MEIKGMVHCFFEQSGTFKNEFIKLGIPAEDYDIQNNFGQTDHVIDLFAEIEKAWGGEKSIFDDISKDDLIMAFFPCIYFTGSTNPVLFRTDCINYRKLSTREKFNAILKRADDRNDFYKLIYKLSAICIMANFRMVIENPYNGQHYLQNNFLFEPTYIDRDRSLRGDYFVKPTGYWFFNCIPTHGETIQRDKQIKRINRCKPAEQAGLCSEERSMISPDYARNFICDFILGKPQKHSQLSIFD